MSSLFRSINNFSDKRENAIKEALVNTLMENVREIEFDIKQSGRECLEVCESTSSLCTTLEAIFLHGLKDSFLWETLSVIAGDVERKPEPSFWSPLMIFLHKQVIEQIQELTQITSEIGQCRAWIRLSLNDSVFSAYLSNIKKNNSALNPYYKKYALLKDNNSLEKTTKLVEELETMVQIKLPFNSSLLNYWPDSCLQLSGLWAPAMKTCPIASGVDIAESLSVETAAIPTPQPVRTNELFSESISNSPFRTSCFGIPDFSQQENNDLFFQKVDAMTISEIKESDDYAEEITEEDLERKEIEEESSKKDQNEVQEALACQEEIDFKPSSSHGNSLTNLMQTSWSSDLNAQPKSPSEDLSGPRVNLQRSISLNSNSSLRSPHSDICSYYDLLRKHRRNQPADLQEIWEKFRSVSSFETRQAENHPEGNSEDQASLDSRTDYEFVSSVLTDKFGIDELQELVDQLCKLPREPGLDGQGFMCKSCQGPLGTGALNFKVCAFSGNYFCDACMDIEPVLIPSRIIFNWDFRKYYISKRAATFLSEFRNQPFIDLKLLNPDIYQAIEPMAELQSLRIRLNFIRAYLITCSSNSFETLQKEFYGNDYLYETIHQYSIRDLNMIQRGTLNNQLQKAYKMGENHILNCLKCKVKGFICEICLSSRIVYPFHIDTTFRCEPCGAVFHDQCLNEKQPCPKCERRKKRQDMVLLEVDENLIDD